MTASNALSKFLAKVIGIYLVIISLALIINMHKIAFIINSMLSNAPLMFVAGAFTLIIGALIIVSHHIWQYNWRVIITIIGWLAFLKGLSIVIFPHFVDELSSLFVHNVYFAYGCAILDLILGLVLLYFGFRRKN